MNCSISVLIWMAIYAYSMYMVGFFLHMHVTMTKRQVVWFLPLSFLWLVLESYFSCLPSSPFQLIMSNVFELSWLLPTLYLFTDHFTLRLIRFSVISWIANGLSFLVIRLYNYREYMLFSQKKLEQVSWVTIAIFAVSVVCVMIAEYPIMQYLLKYRPELDRLYNIVACLYFGIIIMDLIIEINAAAHGEYIMRSAIKGLVAVFLVACIVFLTTCVKQHSLRMRRRQLECRITTMNSQYDEVVARNRNLHKARHEFNKHAEALRAVKGYVPEETRKNMIETAMNTGMQFMAGMSLSGNLMLDTILEKRYRELQEKNIVFETVITPIRFSKDVEDVIVMVQEETFEYAKRFMDDCKWIRFSVRIRGKVTFILFEMGLDDKKMYNRQRFVDMIGDRMIFRQAFSETYSIIARYNGCVDYNVHKSGMEIGVMFNPVGEISCL